LGKKQASNLVFVRPDEFFHGALTGAIAQLKIKASDHAQSYVVGLLTKFLTTEKLFPEDEAAAGNGTLVSQLALAMEEESAEVKRERFRHMGDYSLYIAGFFSGSRRLLYWHGGQRLRGHGTAVRQKSRSESI
jgi:hypothetical protein